MVLNTRNNTKELDERNPQVLNKQNRKSFNYLPVKQKKKFLFSLQSGLKAYDLIA